MKKIFVIFMVSVIGLAAAGIYVYFFSAAKMPAGAKAAAVPVQEVQYPFDKGKGLVNIRVEDVFLGVGMITGEQPTDGSASKDGYTGSVSFEMINQKPGIKIQIDKIRLIGRMPDGQDGAVFDPVRVQDGESAKGRAPRLKYPKGPGDFPVLWESGKNDLVYFSFRDLPPSLTRGDLVITYSGKFPGKKHTAYFEERLAFHRKVYER